jgi:4-amino-4-deoxy-L-arabinose transferase-like glycosyltransferase
MVSEFTPYVPAPTPRPTGKARIILGSRGMGLIIALVSMWLSIIWVAVIPPMNAPDEPAYLQAVMETRNKRMLPEIHFDFSKNPFGDLRGDPGDAAVREYATQHNQGVSLRLTPYENSQPPLYFMITGPVAMLLPSDPQIILYVSRLISALFGAGTVFFCWAAMRELTPGQPMWAVGVAAVIALLPEFCFNNARVGNDSLANCLGSAAFYVWFRGLRQPDYDRWMLRAGAVVGLAVLAKLTAMALIPGLALVVVFRAFQVAASERKWREKLPNVMLKGMRMAAGAAGALLAVCGWWLVRNLIVYGDLTGTSGVNRFYKMRLQVPGFNLGTPEQWSGFMDATWKSFWGVFGWQTELMPEEYYKQTNFLSQLFLGLSVLAALGILVWRLVRWRRFEGPVPVPAYVWQAATVMTAVGILLVISFVQYSLNVAEAPQGRYFFLLLLPGAILFTGGLYALSPGRVLKVIALSVPVLWLAGASFVGLVIVK